MHQWFQMTRWVSSFAFWYCSVRNAEVIPFSTATLSWSCLACSLHTRELPTRYSFTLCRTNQTRFKVIIMLSPSVPVGFVSNIIIVIVTKPQQSNKTYICIFTNCMSLKPVCGYFFIT